MRKVLWVLAFMLICASAKAVDADVRYMQMLGSTIYGHPNYCHGEGATFGGPNNDDVASGLCGQQAEAVYYCVNLGRSLERCVATEAISMAKEWARKDAADRVRR